MPGIAIKYWLFEQNGWGHVIEEPPPQPEPEPEVTGPTDGADFLFIGQPDFRRKPIFVFDSGFLTVIHFFDRWKHQITKDEQIFASFPTIIRAKTKIDAREWSHDTIAPSLYSRVSPFQREIIRETLKQFHDKAYATEWQRANTQFSLWEKQDQNYGVFSNAIINPSVVFTKEQLFAHVKSRTTILPFIREQSTLLQEYSEEQLVSMVMKALHENGEDLSDFDEIEIEIE